MSLQALIFDVGGVIVSHDNEHMHRTLAGRCSAPDALQRLTAHDRERQFTTGALPIQELHARLVRDVGYAGDWSQFTTDYCCHLTVDEDMLAFVEALARTNRVELFSNTNAVHWDHVRAASAGRIDALVQHLSHEIGRLKPDIDAFAHVAERAGIDPTQCLFIDDVMANVWAARRAGFQAEQFTTQAALAELLAGRGVTWT